MKDRLASRLEDEGDFKSAKILDECGTEVMFACNCCGTTRRVLTACKKRWCPACAAHLAAARVTKYETAVLALEWPLEIVLTRRNAAALTTERLADTMRAFRKLRQRDPWRATVRGGFVSLELTNRGKGWHDHLHIIADVEWLALGCAPPRKADTHAQRAAKFRAATRELHDAWCACIAQRQANIYVKRLSRYAAGRTKAAMEAMKYSVKAADLLACKGRASDVVRALKGRRLFRGFGSCYGLKLDPPKSPMPCGECGALNSFVPEFLTDMEQLRREIRRRKRR